MLNLIPICLSKNVVYKWQKSNKGAHLVMKAYHTVGFWKFHLAVFEKRKRQVHDMKEDIRKRTVKKTMFRDFVKET